MNIWKLKDDKLPTTLFAEGDSGGDPLYSVAETADTVKYDNITSMVNWDALGESKLGLRCTEVRNYIDGMFASNASPGYNWDILSTDEKKVVSKYFLVDKDKRDEVLSQAEQDAEDHYRLYHWLSDDVLGRFGGSVDEFATPKSIDYKKDLNVRLHPEFTFDQYGFLTNVVYHEELVVTLNQFGFPVYTFTNPVVKYEAIYNVDPATNYVTSRVITRSWARMSGVWGSDVKTTTKIYNSKQAREEGSRRRKNLINNILIDTVGLLLMTTPSLSTVADTEADAMPFLTEVQAGISLYYESGAKKDSEGHVCKLIQDVTDSTYTRLDNVISASPYMTIRDYIINGLDPA